MSPPVFVGSRPLEMRWRKMTGGNAPILDVLDMLPCGLLLLVREWYLCTSIEMYSVKLLEEVWACF